MKGFAAAGLLLAACAAEVAAAPALERMTPLAHGRSEGERVLPPRPSRDRFPPVWAGAGGALGRLGLVLALPRAVIQPVPLPVPASAPAAPGRPGWATLAPELGLPRLRGRPDPALVRRAERGLRARGFSVGPVDGRPDPITTVAVRRFQQRYRLPVTGLVSGPLVERLERRPRPWRRDQRLGPGAGHGSGLPTGAPGDSGLP